MKEPNSLAVSVWGIALGATGFAAGFFGPIALNPDANQGPMLGLFITGPGGFILGLALGSVCKWLAVDKPRQRAILSTACILGGLVVLYFALPEPEVRGYLVEGRIVSCELPRERIDAAIKHWDQRIAAVTWAAPRDGWRNEVEGMLEEDGAIITLRSERSTRVLEHRKPWDRGRVTLDRWVNRATSETYFVLYRGSRCADYVSRSERLFIENGQGSRDWPPKDLKNFLGYALAEPVPSRLTRLLP